MTARWSPEARRAVLFCAVTLVAVLAVGCLTLSLGKLGIPLTELPGALLGGADGTTAFVLERLRGPRLVTAILAGALLGVSGALFQTVTRNPLGSPDVIGLGAGAGAGVAVTALAFPLVPSSVGRCWARRRRPGWCSSAPGADSGHRPGRSSPGSRWPRWATR